MKGLELSELYYNEICAPMLEARFPEVMEHMAAGLVGQGSECFGFDDSLSRDHDWGASVCLWLDAKRFDTIGPAIHNAMEQLPKEFRGFPARKVSQWSEGRTGVLETGQFYFRLIGSDIVPKTLCDWLVIPETALADATNGKVFSDPPGSFSRFRKALLEFYPEDIRLKKIAAACAKIAQAGQYNFPRCIVRKELVAAAQAKAEFIDAACSVVFLLNKHYKPFYKWMHRAMQPLPTLGESVYGKLCTLSTTQSNEHKIDLIEQTCAEIVQTLLEQGISDATGDFLLDHAVSVQEKIQDEYIKKFHVIIG